nr:hypothetical protein [Tanacetum cinerariifolium]
MGNLSEDIQCAGYVTRPPMLDRTDFASGKQYIRLYCQGKKNRVNILKSIDEAPFQMGVFQKTLAERTEGFPKDIYTLINHYTDAKDIWDNVKILLEGLSLTDNLIKSLTNTLSLLTKSYKTYLPQTNNQLKTSSKTRNQATVQDDRVVVQNVQGRQNGEYFKDKMLLMQAQESRVALDEEQLLFIAGGQDNVVDEDVDEQPVQDLALNVDNVFQADDCDAFDSDVDEAPIAQTMFMENLSSAYHVYDEVSPSYDSNFLFEPALYNGHEIIKTNHVPVMVHNSEDTLEIAEITRKKMNEKMKDPECVKKKVKIAPHDYSKENYLETFTPQTQLTPKQIF